MGAVSLYTGGLLFMASVAHFTLSAPVYEDEHALQTQELIGEVKGCYYNFEHYDEGDRILTNEPCLNCTCHNRMLMCYLRVCPFTKAIGQDCKVEKRPDQCCPVITCPQVPVALLTSSTTEISPTTSALGRPDSYGCTLEDNKFYADGAQVPSDPKKPCELCYCIRNHTACVMQECTLNVEGCRPVYQDGICCPVRYDCDYDDVLTTPKPTVGLVTTPGGQSECRVNNTVYFDGEMIDNMTANPCEHCYCMRGDVVCAVQECGTPLQDSDCRAMPAESGQCCPSTYACANGTIPAQNTPAQPTSENMSHEEEKVEGGDNEHQETAPIPEVTSEASENKPDVEKLDESKPLDDGESEPAPFDQLPNEHKEETTSTSAPYEQPSEVDEPKPNRPDTPSETTASTQYTEISVENVEINTAPPSFHHETTSQPETHSETQEPITSDDIVSKPTEIFNQQESESEISTVGVDPAPQEVTTVKTEETSQGEETRVPGEGSCLVGGKTYEPDAEVPVINKCQKSCKCINSIVVCEEIECTPFPPNAEGCRPLDIDSCCPSSYECDPVVKPSDLPETQDQIITTKHPEVSEPLGVTTESNEGVDRVDITTSSPSNTEVKVESTEVEIPTENLAPAIDDVTPSTDLPSAASTESSPGSSGENLSPESIHSESAIHGGSDLDERPVITSDESSSHLDEKVEGHPSEVDQEEAQPSEVTTQASDGYGESQGVLSSESVSFTTGNPPSDGQEETGTSQAVDKATEPGLVDTPAHEHHEIELTTGGSEESIDDTGTTPSSSEIKEPESPAITTETHEKVELTTGVPLHEVESPTQPPADDVSPFHDSIAAGTENAAQAADHVNDISDESPQGYVDESVKQTTEASMESVNSTPAQETSVQEHEPSSSEANVIPHDETLQVVQPSQDNHHESPMEEEPGFLTTTSTEEGTPAPEAGSVPANDNVETSHVPEVINEIIQGSQQEAEPEVDKVPPQETLFTTAEPAENQEITGAPAAESSVPETAEKIQETTLSSLVEHKPEEVQFPEEVPNVDKLTPSEEHSTEVVEHVEEPEAADPAVSITTALPEKPADIADDVAHTNGSPEEVPQTVAISEASPPVENPIESHIGEEVQVETTSKPEEPVQPETSYGEESPKPETHQEPLEEVTPETDQKPEVDLLLTTSQPVEPSESAVPHDGKPEETPEVTITTEHPVEEPVTQVGPSRPSETLTVESQLSGSTEKSTISVQEEDAIVSSQTAQPTENVEVVKEEEPVSLEIVPSNNEEVAKPADVTEVPITVSTDAPNLIPGEDLSGNGVKPVEIETPSIVIPSEEPLPGVGSSTSEDAKPVNDVAPEQPEVKPQVTDKAPEQAHEEPLPSSSSAPLQESSSTTAEPTQPASSSFNPGSSFFQQWTPKPFEPQSTSEAPHPPEDSHYPSGFEPEYEDDDGVSYGPGTCRYGGKVYLSAQQIPRDDPCDFCFCFRSDIICLQQSCPPPIKGCYQETIKGFCCPRYECHVSMATMLNLTTTTTTTTTTLPPLFFAHAYKGVATKAGCQVNGVAYNVGDRIASTSGPCLSCRCDANGQMRCDPTVCGPQETLLRQVMDAASVARRR